MTWHVIVCTFHFTLIKLSKIQSQGPVFKYNIIVKYYFVVKIDVVSFHICRSVVVSLDNLFFSNMAPTYNITKSMLVHLWVNQRRDARVMNPLESTCISFKARNGLSQPDAESPATRMVIKGIGGPSIIKTRVCRLPHPPFFSFPSQVDKHLPCLFSPCHRHRPLSSLPSQASYL